MYGHKARETVLAILKEDPELIAHLQAKIRTPARLRKIADRLLIELWMRGYAVEARRVGAKPLKNAPDHKAWREGRLARDAAKRKQADVEEAPPS